MPNPIDISAFKPLTSDDMYKGDSITYSSFKVASGSTVESGDTYLKWYMVARGTEDWSASTDALKNLFMSFGIAREDEEDWYRALGQLTDYYNAKHMLIAVLPESECGSYIDGSTVKWTIPTSDQNGGAEYVTLYGSSFGGYPFKNSQGNTYMAARSYDDSVYGGVSCYLFGNTKAGTGNVGSYITDGEHPYTGQVQGGQNLNSAAETWDHFVVATDDPHCRATHWSVGDDGHDSPLGIANLEKGIFVAFDSYGRDNLLENINNIFSGGSTMIWTGNPGPTFTAVNSDTNLVNTNVNTRTDISFTGAAASTAANISYRTVTHDYKMIYFCHAGQHEFNSTSNHTYNHAKAYYRPDEADSVWVTEIALYADDSDIPLAFAKLSEPVEKNKLETLTFKVTLSI